MEEIEKERLNWHGRFLDNNGIRYFNYSASGFSFVFRGTKVEADFVTDCDKWSKNEQAVLGIYIWEGVEDSVKFLPEKLTKKVILNKNESKVTIFESNEVKNVCIFVIKLSECKYSFAGLKGLYVDGFVINKLGGCNYFSSDAEGNQLKIEAIGDSITCGYGIEGCNGGEFSTGDERPDLSYAFVAARRLGAEIQCCSWSGIGILSHWIEEWENVPDADFLMGNCWPYTDRFLSERLGLEPEPLNCSKFPADLVIVNLGTNDSSYVRNVAERRVLFVAFYKQLLEAVHRGRSGAKILCCYGMMEQGLCSAVKEAVEKFRHDFPGVKAEFLQLPIQDEKDGIGTAGHPSEISHKKAGLVLAEKISSFIK